MNKLKNESGSALLLAIFLLVLVSIVMISFSTQVGNQVKSTMNLNKDIQEKYNEESIIEEGISRFIENIEVEIPKSSVNNVGDKKYIDYQSKDIRVYYKDYINDYSIKNVNAYIENDIVKFNINFNSEDNKKTEVLVKISQIDSQDNYKIYYDILSWRNK